MQRIFNDYSELEKYLTNNKCQKILLVCTHSFYKSNLYNQLKELDKDILKAFPKKSKKKSKV